MLQLTHGMLPWHAPSLAAGFAGALEMQIEALQDRLSLAERVQRAPPPVIEPAPPPPGLSQAEAAALERQLERAQAQNSTLRATAARLSRALAAVMQRSTGHGRGASSAAALADGCAAAGEVLAQLSAVDGMLAGLR